MPGGRHLEDALGIVTHQAHNGRQWGIFNDQTMFTEIRRRKGSEVCSGRSPRIKWLYYDGVIPEETLEKCASLGSKRLQMGFANICKPDMKLGYPFEEEPSLGVAINGMHQQPCQALQHRSQDRR